MCKTLARLLDVPEEGLSLSIHQLELACGQPSNDVRLTAEVVGKVYQATKALGLDPGDTTGPELYHSLVGLIGKHDEFLVRRISGKETDGAIELAPKIIHIVNKLKMPKQVWAIKHSAVKRLLKQQVPKRAMKQLGYRSLAQATGDVRYIGYLGVNLARNARTEQQRDRLDEQGLPSGARALGKDKMRLQSGALLLDVSPIGEQIPNLVHGLHIAATGLAVVSGIDIEIDARRKLEVVGEVA